MSSVSTCFGAKSFARLAFEQYLRTGRPSGGRVQVKFNPNHDPRNGQFTFGPGGAGGASGTERPASANQSRRPTRPPARSGTFEPNPRARIGNNGGPPLNDPMTIEQVFPQLVIAQAGGMFAMVDDFLDLTGPGRRTSAEGRIFETQRLISQIREIDPNYRFQSLGPPTTTEGQMNQIRALRMDRALARYRMRGDIEPLQVEALGFLQRHVDSAYEEGLKLYRAGRLKAKLNENEAIGNFVDARVREELRGWYRANGVSIERGQPIQVNRRAPNSADGRYSIPDSRVGRLAFDVSLTPKSLKTPQVMNFFRSDFKPDVVVIVRPSQLGPNHTYAITKPKGL